MHVSKPDGDRVHDIQSKCPVKGAANATVQYEPKAQVREDFWLNSKVL